MSSLLFKYVIFHCSVHNLSNEISTVTNALNKHRKHVVYWLTSKCVYLSFSTLCRIVQVDKTMLLNYTKYTEWLKRLLLVSLYRRPILCQLFCWKKVTNALPTALIGPTVRTRVWKRLLLPSWKLTPLQVICGIFQCLVRCAAGTVTVTNRWWIICQMSSCALVLRIASYIKSYLKHRIKIDVFSLNVHFCTWNCSHVMRVMF